jgi:hypothetical protein
MSVGPALQHSGMLTALFSAENALSWTYNRTIEVFEPGLQYAVKVPVSMLEKVCSVNAHVLDPELSEEKLV